MDTFISVVMFLFAWLFMGYTSLIVCVKVTRVQPDNGMVAVGLFIGPVNWIIAGLLCLMWAFERVDWLEKPTTWKWLK